MPLYTKDEWDGAHQEFASRIHAMEATLQKLCTEVAQRRPIRPRWVGPEEPMAPWGCILDPVQSDNPGYCDECPVKDVCPYPNKEWSK